MNFFKSVFADDPTPPGSPPSPAPPPATSDSDWSFGGLLQTLATKSESVIEAYRRDFEELGSGLRKETSLIREVASRAVKDLPSSLEAGASVAQDSLETVGQAIDDIGSTVWNSTAQIILGKANSHLAASQSNHSGTRTAKRAAFGVRYSRFDAQLRGMQGDLDTYCTEPEEKEAYEAWRLNCWVLDEARKEEIDRLFRENDVVRAAYNEVVPSSVDSETFWRRYFYRLDRLKKAEEARALIVKRAMSSGKEEEEDFSWDFDEEEGKEASSSMNAVVEEDDASKIEEEEVAGVDGSHRKLGEEEKGKGIGNGSESCKDSDISVVSSQSVLAEVEDLGWDEIEYTGSNDEGKEEEAIGSASTVSSSSRVDLRKRLNATEEEEDLSWDIEDENDEHVKS